MKQIKICQECGLEFEATNGMQKFCKRQHFRKCIICGESFEITSYHLTAKDAKVTCSTKCRNILRKRTNVMTYGGTAPASSKDVQAKMQATNLERYGVAHAAQSKDIQEKMKTSNQEKYGVDWYSQTQEWVESVKKTSLDRYSSVWPTASETVKMHTLETNLNRYGTENPMQSDIVKSKFIQTHMRDGSKLAEFIKFKSDPVSFIQSLQLDHKPTLYELTRIVGVNESTIGVYVHKYKCEDLISFQTSVMEQEVADFIHSVCNYEVRMNVHDIITPNELDIYVPERKLAIECNPSATHNSTINVFDRGPSTISPSYHLAKTRKCEDVGIFLFHIFGYEWVHNRRVIQSMLRNLLEANTTILYARKCKVHEIDGKSATVFLNDNHRQGSANSPIRIGLHYEDELVSVMTFGKMRNTIGTDNTDLSDCWELVRFCSKLDTTVVGAASKLFNYFIQTYHPARIRSFSDRAHTTGKLYSTLGFDRIRESGPGYVWVDLKTDKSYNRYHAQKSNISAFLGEHDLDLSKSEKQIMEDHGFVQVFDCGTILWEWRA